VYQAYLDKLTRFAVWLLDKGYTLRVYSTEISVDRYAMEDLQARLRAQGCPPESLSQIFQRPSATVADVLQQMAGFDFIVTAKFHGIVFSHLLGKPIVSLSYHRKMDAAMSSVGQSRFNADIERFDVEWLIGAFQSLAAESDGIKSRCRTAVQARAADLSRQFDFLFTDSTAAIA
jgi:polysaccharide pyruvyl transferase WcaK-like protein